MLRRNTNMELFRSRFHFFCLLVISSLAVATESDNNGTISDAREPRVTGRIVKLYSGNRPEPVICIGEGFQADPQDCAVFYRCMKSGKGKYTVFRFQCGPGTVYDPETEVCNHPRSTKRTECGGFAAPLPSLDREQTNEIEGVNQEVPSPMTTEHPVEYKENAYTTNPKITTSTPYTSQNNPYYPGKPEQSTSVKPIISTPYPFSASSVHTGPQFIGTRNVTTESTTTLNSRHPGTDNICTTDGFIGDTDNCRKFYRCVGNQRGGYTKYEFACSESTIWDDEIQSCNHAWAVKRSRCGKRNSYNNNGSDELITTEPIKYFLEGNREKDTETVQQQLQISFGSKVTQTQTQISNGSVIQNQTQIHYGDRIPHNKIVLAKQNQTQISQTSAVSQSQTQIGYGHKGMQTQLQIDHSQQSSQSQTHIQEPSASVSPSTDSTISSIKKDTVCTQSGFMGDVSDCKKFYRCVDDGKGTFTNFEFSCGEGTVWDPKIEACNHAWAVTECGGAISSQNTPNINKNTSSATTDPPTSTQNYYTTHSTEIYLTTHMANTETEDNSDTGYGNQNSQTTVLLTETTTTQVKSTTTEKSQIAGTGCTSSGFVGDKNNCKIFYRCVENGDGTYTKHEFKCGEGTVWDPNIEACNHAWAVKHCGGVAAPADNGKVEETTIKPMTSPSLPTQNANNNEITTTESKVTNNDDYDTGYGQQNNDFALTTIKIEEQQNENHNANTVCKQIGFMGDPKDCKKFYRCVDNGNGDFTRYDFACGEGTVWDPEIEACNHVWAVKKCGGTDSNINSHETSSKPQTTSTLAPQTVASSTDKNIDTDTTMSTTSTSTSTNDVISTGNECKRSGFMGDDNDCKKFYRCVDNGNGFYTRYEFSCGEGTVWDSKIEACNHAWAVEKCGGTSSSTESSQTTVPQYYVTEHDEIDNIYGSSTATQQYPLPTQASTLSDIKSEDSKDPMKNDVCKNSGFIGDKINCKKFYRCVDDGKGGFNSYEFDCGEGTLWDQSIEACNHAWVVKECGYSEASSSSATPQINSTTETTAMTSDFDDQGYGQESVKTSTTGFYQDNDKNYNCMKEGFMGDQNNCKKFYRCVDDGHGSYNKYEFTCGDGTYWNQEILSCDHAPADKICKGANTESTSKIPEHQHDELNTDSTTKQSSTTDDSHEVNSTQKPQMSGTCNAEGFYGDPSNCKKFYRCVDNGSGGYIKYDFSCGDGTIWDQEIQSCNHESSNNKCSTDNNVQTTTSQSETSSLGSFTSESPNTTEKIESSTSSAGVQCASDGFFAVPDDCKRFIRCVSNEKGGYTKYEFSCGEGTIWNQDILACDHGNSLNCSSQTQTTATHESEIYSSTSEEPQMTYPSTSPNNTSHMPDKYEDEYYSEHSTNQPPGNGKCTSEGFYGNDFDCRRFYRCVDNGNGGFTKYDFTCGEGTAWDQEIQACNHIDQVKTCHNTNHNSMSTSTLLPVMHDENGHSTETTGTSSQSTSSSTLTTSAATESLQSAESTDGCTEEGYFGNKQDCKKFYRCVDNGKGGYTKYDYTCGDGTIWDQDITTCNHPQDVTNPSCTQSQGESSTSGTTTVPYESSSLNSSATQSTSSDTAESSTQSSSNCSQEESSKKPPTSNVNCTKEGYYPNPDDCKKFYRCVDWDGDGKRFSVYHFECGEGTIWDPAVETCNHEESVYPPRDCSGSQSQAQTENQQSTTVGTTTTHEETSSSQESTTTSQEITTTAGTTTQSSTTSEQTTTQQSTTTEQTTTQQPTTTEQTTTQQSTTSEQTTTQQSTTSEQTTTQQTTSEQTTTHKPETSDQTTTAQTSQKPSTTEQTTTSEKTTTEQTTTEESTTKQTSTEESTTSEQTTQKTTTSEQSTTQQSQTSETMTEGTTTSELTTTQESTNTSEQATPSSTTDDMSQQSTTESSTTEQSTTPTEETHTEESSTNGGTTESTTEPSTTEQSTTDGSSTTTEGNLPNKECPETDDDQNVFVCPTSFKRHPKYCNMFYQCSEDDSHDVKIATFTCPNNTVYDETQTKCVEESNSDKKCDGEIAPTRRFKRLDLDTKEPIVAGKQSYACSSPGYFSFEDNECSPAFFKCKIDRSKKLRGYVYQCPKEYVYWSISKRCERRDQVVHCKLSKNDWSGRWEIPIERKNVDTS